MPEKFYVGYVLTKSGMLIGLYTVGWWNNESAYDLVLMQHFGKNNLEEIPEGWDKFYDITLNEVSLEYSGHVETVFRKG